MILDIIPDSLSTELVILLIAERIIGKVFAFLKQRSAKKEALRIQRWKE